MFEFLRVKIKRLSLPICLIPIPFRYLSIFQNPDCVKLFIQTPAKVLNKAYLKQNVQQNDILRFQQNIHALFEKLNPNESEENQKNLVRDFLKKSHYHETNYELNTAGREDLVIHRGKTSKDSVGVIIENKRIDSPEMITENRPNVKALHELILYYFVEREVKKNIEVSHLIATDLHNWYVFDENDFRKLFYENTAFKKIYQTKIQQNKDNGFFYTEIKKLIETLTDLELPCANFKLNKDVTNLSAPVQIALYKLLSPEHLLKFPFENDANSLNREFYNELLYIIGLEEVKDGGKKIIQRKLLHNRLEGTMLENTINEIEVDNALFNLDNLNSYGQNQEEQLFNVGLELCITWLNRILFLKLLEGQLIKYHSENQSYSFLNEIRVKDFDELSELFFEVLAVPTHQRKPSVTERYGNIPYLNSSLFELTELERKVVKIKDLKDRLSVPIYAQSVLKGDKGKRKQGEMPTVKYLFEFLDAYDFASDSSAQIQEQAKTIINASVLGLIFEKINGYRDGSFFTPGFITMYMCRETLRKAVLEKFRLIFPDKNIATFEDLKEHLDITDSVKRRQYNEIVNSVRVCDPAVGSGHFLVSALNEFIAIKHDLQILCHRDGSRVRYYKITIENDELIIFDEDDELFEYRLNEANKPIERLQKLQETLFHEKETIIENCLFGVDINPNSVKICRLRLWIELLKNAYYQTTIHGMTQSHTMNELQLQTLPNIDINIKTGNSLVARFGLEEDLSEVFKKQKFSVKDYKQAVYDYKNSPTKERKAEVLRFIDEIKKEFVQTVYKKDARRKQINNLRGQLMLLQTQNVDIFGNKIKEDAEIETIRLEKLITQREGELENAINSPIYRNAFEWRFEFPEVLDEEGKFVGFDAVVGNPPYGVKFDDNSKFYFNTNYKCTSDIYTMFVEKGLKLISSNKLISFIMPVSWLTGDNYTTTRKLLKENGGLDTAINLPYGVFDEAYVDTGIYLITNQIDKNTISNIFEFKPKDKILKDFNSQLIFRKLNQFEWHNTEKYKIILNRDAGNLTHKFYEDSIKIESISNSVRGILANDTDVSKTELDSNSKLFFNGKLNRYLIDKPNSYVRYGENLKEKPKNYSFFCGTRILIRRIISRQFRIMAMITNEEFVSKKDIYIFKVFDNNYSSLFILGLINSILFSYMKTQSSTSAKKDDFTQLTLSDIRELPIKVTSLEQQLPIINLVEKILSLKSKNPQADTQVFEDEIDELVFGLYDLSIDEREIVLGNKMVSPV